MPIRVLAEAVASHIAAGEVVELLILIRSTFHA
jgi:DNA mismatch repair ATPase MutL